MPGTGGVHRTPTLTEAEEAALVTAIVNAVDNPEVTPEDIVINDDETTFDDEECDGDDNGGDVNIEDRSQTNVGENVVNIILDDVQSPVVDNDHSANVTNNQSNT